MINVRKHDMNIAHDVLTLQHNLKISHDVLIPKSPFILVWNPHPPEHCTFHLETEEFFPSEIQVGLCLRENYVVWVLKQGQEGRYNCLILTLKSFALEYSHRGVGKPKQPVKGTC